MNDAFQDNSFERRIKALLAEELTRPPRWWYLSFADRTGWLGGVFIYAPGFTHAVLKTHQLKINPGGEVCGASVTEEPPVEFQNRLLGLDDLEALGGAETGPW